MKKVLAILLACTLGCFVGCGDNTKDPVDTNNYTFSSFTNPTLVLTGTSDYKDEVADPSIVKGDDGYFYIFATNQVVLRSQDACNWEFYKRGLFPTPSWSGDPELYPNDPGGCAIWAPDVIKIGDKWIYYYSLSGWGKCCGIGLAVADEIAGPYTDLGKLFSYKQIGIDNAIDPHVFVDYDGRVYMSVGSFQGLYIVELTADGLGLMGGLETQKNEKILIAGKVGGWDGSTYEGSYIIEKDGYYYYFGSVGTCCEGKNSTYRVVCGRSESITGPYLDSRGLSMTMSGNGVTVGEPVLNTGFNNPNYAGAGHNSILKDDAGDYWIYYHAYSAKDNFRTRHLFMNKLFWTEDGWPYVENNVVDNETGESELQKYKPSFDEELDGPRFLVKE